MQTTLTIYIVIAVLFLLPLVGLNIRRIWVKKAGEATVFNLGRCIGISLISVICLLFLYGSYRTTLTNRPEIALEKIAQAHAKLSLGISSQDEFSAYLNSISDAQMVVDLEPVPAATGNKVRFQLSKRCLPKYWKDKETFFIPSQIEDENPIYMSYFLEIDGEQIYYAVCLRKIDTGWKLCWIGEANEDHIKLIEMPSIRNGKWYSVSK